MQFLQQKWELKLEHGEFDTPVEMARHMWFIAVNRKGGVSRY